MIYTESANMKMAEAIGNMVGLTCTGSTVVGMAWRGRFRILELLSELQVEALRAVTIPRQL